jgi:PPP family 3-phenylpropionic acid transporter
MASRRFGFAARLSVLQAASFVGLGVYLPFFPIWLERRELAPSAIGLILALPILVRIVATAPLMTLLDRGVGARALIVGAKLALAATYAALSVAHGFWPIALLVAVMAVAQAPVIPASDLVTMNAVRENPRLDYGRMRLWGSVAFLAASVASGHMLGVIDPAGIVWVLAGLAAAGVAVSWWALAGKAATAGERQRAERVASPRFPTSLRFVVMAAALTQASHAAVYGFGSLHWKDLGFSSAVIGYLWAAGILAEILLFAWFGRVVGQGRAVFGFIVAGSAAAIIRFAAMATEPGPAPTFALQLLHGLSFGATHLGTIAAVAWLAPGAARGRAQGVLSSALALAMATATVLSGLVFRGAGPLVFAAMVPLAAGGLVCALLAARAEGRQPHREGEGG